ncbi:midnolin-A-like [Lycorma delicatula]|uniref:midnolin-A-like n=1 Tax=Lycorma delicatula TaxID=130591 RepID=UPI003F5163DE
MENSSNSAAAIESTTQNQNDSDSGCGCSNITISVNPTTGGQFDLAVTKNDTIENLKKLISKKLKVPKERICLLHRERQLRDGTVQENQLVNGSRLTLLPSVETGLLAQRPEQSVMQALESLNDCQVNDFLSGKAPLNLTMRLGDHMMLIQLQLSTVTPNNQTSTSTTTSSTSSSFSSSSSSATTTSFSSLSSGSKRVTVSPNKSPSVNKTTSFASNQHKDPLASLSSIVESTTPSPSVSSANSSTTTVNNTTSSTNKNVVNSNDVTTSNPNSVSYPANTSVLTSSSTSTTISPSAPVLSSSSTSSPSSTVPSSSSSSVPGSTLLEGCKCDSSSSKPTLDTRALAEASRNLTQTLKQLSSEVLTSKSDPVEDVTASTKRRQGAIIESMHHHGKGVYSGTFSGTLNPALQDRFGRPKRDISTIIHILNDLLCATPQYRNCRGGSSNNSNTSNTNSDKSSSNTPPTASTLSDAEGTGSSFVSTSESLENQATRGKMERLRLIMEERREKRRAARSSPYARNSGGQMTGQHINSLGGINHTQWSAKSESQRTNSSSTADQPNLPMDTTDLCSQPEVTPEPVVA